MHSGRFMTRPVKSDREACRLELSYKILLCVLLFPPTRDKEQLLKQPTPAEGFCQLWRAPADTPAEGTSKTDCAEELFLQHSPGIVVLAQLPVSRLQHPNEDKWSRQGNNFFSERHTQAKFPQMTPTRCNNIVSSRSVLN